jgi:hypothetical protein
MNVRLHPSSALKLNIDGASVDIEKMWQIWLLKQSLHYISSIVDVRVV